MINRIEKDEHELIELKKFPYEIYYNSNSQNYKNIIFFVLVISLFVIIGMSFIIYKRYSTYYKFLILEKDTKIKRIKEIINKLKEENVYKKYNIKIENKEKQKEKINLLEKEYLFDKDIYITNNMYSDENLNKINYLLLIQQHTLEKGFCHFELRPFGQKKIKKLMGLLKKQLKYKNYKKDFSFLIGINSLKEYNKAYETHNWINTSEYNKVSEFLKDYKYIPEKKTGAFTMINKELKNKYFIDYKSFIRSRHSTRNYKNEELRLKDIEKAVEIAKYSPSSCNRQYVKLHYYPKGKMKQNVIDYSLGKDGIYLEGVNIFIITIDLNGIGVPGERNQGYFNAGLFAANLVNSFHSLGIGSCFIKFDNPVEQEEELKKLNDIPSYERIAVILMQDIMMKNIILL